MTSKTGLSIVFILKMTMIFKAIIAQGSENLLINGNFSQPKILNGSRLRSNNVSGWTSVSEFDIAKGPSFNPSWSANSQVVQLANPLTESLSQIFESDYDYYQLSFQYAKANNYPVNLFNQTQAKVLWNGRLIYQIFVSDGMVHTFSIQLFSNKTTNQIQFLSTGTHVSRGIAYTNIKVIGYCNSSTVHSVNQNKCLKNQIAYCLQIESIDGNCTKCQQFLIPQGKSCNCQAKFFLSGSVCKPCLFPCENCQGSPRNCSSCQDYYRLQGNQCVIDDDFGSFAFVVASIPGYNFLTFGQILIGNLNQFWPYYSHHRHYGQQTDEILTFIHNIQNNKWFLLSLDKKIDFNFQSLNFSDYGHYSNQQFLRKQSRTSYFWDGAFQIFVFTFPTTLLIFLILNKLFDLTFNYPISRYFRPYSFFFMIYVLGFEGDVSYLSFLSFSNSTNLFSFKFQDKIGHFFWSIVSCLLFLFCIGGFLIARILYKQLSKYFIEEFFFKIQSFNILSFIHTKNFIIGAINSLIATNYQSLIISLGFIEAINLVGLAYFQHKFKCYRKQSLVYFLMLKSILMIFFNVSLWIDWKQRVKKQADQNYLIQNISDHTCKVLIVIILGLGVFQMISAYFSGRDQANLARQKDKFIINKKEIALKQTIEQESLSELQSLNYQIKIRQKIKTNFTKYKKERQIVQQSKNKRTQNHKDKLKENDKYNKLLVIWGQNNEQENMEVIFLNVK